MDALAPTPEFLRKHAGAQIEAPQRDRQTNRVAYRRLTPFESLHKAGRLTDDEFLAGQKLTRHWLGSTGVDVRQGFGAAPDDPDTLDFPTTYHGQKLAEMRRAVGNPRQWGALMALAEEHLALEEIGRAWLKCQQRGQAFIAGLALVKLGLDRIASARPPPAIATSVKRSSLDALVKASRTADK